MMPRKTLHPIGRTERAQRTAHATARSADPDPLASLRALLVDEGPAAWIVDSENCLIYGNAAYRRLSRALAAAGLGPDPDDTRAPAPRGGTKPSATPGAVLASESAEHSIVVDGRTDHFRLRRLTLSSETDGGVAIATLLTPVQGPEAGNAALALERLKDLTRLVSDWIWETDRNLVLTFVSPRVNEALGYHQIELTGRVLTDLPIAPSEALSALVTPGGRRPFRDVGVQIADSKGRVRKFLLSGVPVFYPKADTFLGFRGTARDVTELRSREAATLKAKHAAEMANRAKSEFLAHMSHELRTPLNAIIGFSEIMGGRLFGPLGNEKYEGYVQDITDSAHHLLVVINDILDAAKIESGQASLCVERVEPVALLRSVQRLMAPRVDAAGLVLEVHAPPDLPALSADQTKLKQILINLASNAVKFTKPGGRVALRARLTETGDFVYIVSDTGIGMDPDDIPRALAPFGQVDSRLHRKFEGTGLGLPIAKSMTELHGGTLHFVSQPNLGTTVTVRLPAERVMEV